MVTFDRPNTRRAGLHKAHGLAAPGKSHTFTVHAPVQVRSSIGVIWIYLARQALLRPFDGLYLDQLPPPAWSFDIFLRACVHAWPYQLPFGLLVRIST